MKVSLRSWMEVLHRGKDGPSCSDFPGPRTVVAAHGKADEQTSVGEDPDRLEAELESEQPNLGLNDGDGILSVDGVAYRPGLSFASLLREKAGQPVNLVVQ